MEEFDLLTEKMRGKVRFLYFHLMGEPFLHPDLPEFITLARDKGFIPVLTTNGTLLSRAKGVIEAKPHKIQISLHSHEGNGKDNPQQYIKEVMDFTVRAAEAGIVVVLRLWNQGGYDRNNDLLHELVAERFPRPWDERHYGWRVAKNVYLEYARMFEWPDNERKENTEKEAFCYALRNQFGVLVDGTVVPCCLDHAGDIPLGNLFEQQLDEIMASPRARAIYDGFTRHVAVEPLCRRCGYAAVIKKLLVRGKE